MRLFLLLIFLALYLFADTKNEVYREKLIKNRAHKQEKMGVSKHQRRLYYYADDKKIEEEIKKGGEVKIASPVLDKKTKARSVEIFVEAKKPIVAKKVEKLDIASPTIDHRSMIKNINVNLNLKKEVKVK